MQDLADTQKEPAPVPARPRRRAGALRAVTRTEELRLRIADEITSGRLAPGTALEEVEIAKRYGVSRTPVREAIRDLAASGLVEARPHRSALVARPSVERLQGMFEAMAELESLCAALAAVHMTAAERAGLERLHAAFAAASHAGDAAQCGILDTRFHAAVHAGSHNDYLAELAGTTRARLGPFLKDTRKGVEHLAQSHAGHERVLDAILRGDRCAAGEAMRAHAALPPASWAPACDGAPVLPARQPAGAAFA